MAASHPEMSLPSTVDEDDFLKLVKNHLLPSRAVLQWWPAMDEDIPTPNTNNIVVLTSFFYVLSVSPLANSSAAFSITIKSSWFT
jgi:hypothetical protein